MTRLARADLPSVKLELADRKAVAFQLSRPELVDRKAATCRLTSMCFTIGTEVTDDYIARRRRGLTD